MDAPLLALTRRRDTPPGATIESVAAKNMRQLIQLRWIAVLGQAVAISVSHFQLGVVLPLAAMLLTVLALAAANIGFQLALSRNRSNDIELFLALFLDVLALTTLLYLSGGATNPFVSLYLLQIVLGAIILPQLWVWLLVVTTALAYGGLSLSYRPLILPEALQAELSLMGDWISFLMVAVLLVLFSGRITRNLRARDAYLAEQKRRAVEEDGIMRMGLFASNAAHELSTPLATLSVLVSDWRKHPVFTKDRELSCELEDMYGEVRRCTAIVEEILRSAGKARSEPVHRVAVAQLLCRIAGDWQRAHPDAGLTIDIDEAAEEQIPDEAELRQALVNMLDNAAHVSSSAMSLGATVQDDEVVLRVCDEGPGFNPDQLDLVGTPYHTTKGSGHGLGLFLASTVARRLGGRLAARNRADGGAEVSLTIPRLAISDRTQ